MALIDMQRNIKHVVHLMFENRGFDTLLGWLYDEQNQPQNHIPPLAPGEPAFEGVPHDANGNPTVWQPDDPSFFGSGPYLGGQRWIHKGNWGDCFMPLADPGEPWDDVKQQIYGPNSDATSPEKLMRGFWLNYQQDRVPWIGSKDDILATSTPRDLPVINKLAAAFAVSDRWFSSAPTETNPNRAFSLAGTSLGRKINQCFDGEPFTGLRTLFGVLNDTGHAWKLYADHYWFPIDGQLYFTQYMFPEGMPADSSSPKFGSIEQFRRDVDNDNLPVFSYIEPAFFAEFGTVLGNDYHPPGSLYDGERTLKRVYDILKSAPEVFKKTLLIITFDEHGGTYDHMLPPAALPPDDESNDFNRYGLRVPTLLISPWVLPGCVFRPVPEPRLPLPLPLVPVFDHTSVLATLMRWLEIPYKLKGDVGWLQSRTATAWTFEDAITSTYNSAWPRVHPFSCSDIGLGERKTIGATRIPQDVVSPLVERITRFRPGSPEHETIVAEILATSQTEEELTEHFVRLKRLHGSNPRPSARES
jgi:phospholipase C